MKDHIEPVALKAFDPRVRINGLPCRVDFRIIAEDEYQRLISEIDRLTQELEDQELNQKEENEHRDSYK